MAKSQTSTAAPVTEWAPALTAEEQETVAACQAALAPLARIDPKGERRSGDPLAKDAEALWTGRYRLSRCHVTTEITAADIALARAVVAGRVGDPPHAVTLADCRAALRPLARLPVDSRVEKPGVPIFAFPADGGGNAPVELTNADIQKAKDLFESL